MPRNEYHNTPVVGLHEAFGLPVAWTPTVPPLDRRRLRIKLIFEELVEFIEASGATLLLDGQPIKELRPTLAFTAEPNLVEATDALADLTYVVDGTALEWGIPLERCLREVHRSNMSKLGADGQPILREDGKFLKGPNYEPPDIKTILDLATFVGGQR